MSEKKKSYTFREIDNELWQKIKVLAKMNQFSSIQNYIMTVMAREVHVNEKKMGKALVANKRTKLTKYRQD